jgi:hypothetical protein
VLGHWKYASCGPPVSIQTRCSAHVMAWLHSVSLMFSKNSLLFTYIIPRSLPWHDNFCTSSQSQTFQQSIKPLHSSPIHPPHLHTHIYPTSQYKHVLLNCLRSRCLPGLGQRSSSPSKDRLHLDHLQWCCRRELRTQRPPRWQPNPYQ